MAESEEELKNLMMKVKEKSEKSWFKTQHSKNYDQGIWAHHLMANILGNHGKSNKLYFLGLQNHGMLTAAMKLKDDCSLVEKL